MPGEVRFSIGLGLLCKQRSFCHSYEKRIFWGLNCFTLPHEGTTGTASSGRMHTWQGHLPQPGFSRETWASSKHSHHYSALCSCVCGQDLGANRIHCHAQPGHHVMAARQESSGRAAPHKGSKCSHESKSWGQCNPAWRIPHLGQGASVAAATIQTAQTTSLLKRGTPKAAIQLPLPGVPPETESLKSHSSSYLAEGASSSILSSLGFRDRSTSLIYQNQDPQCYKSTETVQKIHPKEISSYQAFLHDEIQIIPVQVWHSVQGLQIQRSLLVWLANKHHIYAEEERKCLVPPRWSSQRRP